MKRLFSILQKIGKSLMLPVSVLPAAGILLRLGQPDLLNIPYIAQAGDVIFTNLPMIFAVGVAIGFSGGEGTAALAAVVGQLILEGIVKVASEAAGSSINMGVFGGIVIGLIAGSLYNRYHNIRLPQVLGFFGGKRFVPIITSAAALLFAVIGVNIWIPVQRGIDIFARWASGSVFGPAFYAAGKRLLIPVGLHHMYYPPFLYQFGQYVSDGVVYFGDFARYFHGDPTAGVFMASEFPILMFGLPGAAAAMIMASKKENRAKIEGMMVSAAFVAFVTGITEPIEFSFIFVAPGLFIFHVLAAFTSGIVTSLLNIRLGYTFSASAIDYALGYNFAGNPLLLWPVGIAYFILYFAVFYFSIRKFNLKTPGREEDDEDLGNPVILRGSEKAAKVLDAVGGKDNIEVLDACITRLRLTLKDTSKLDKSALKALGSAGVLQAGHSVQVVFGTEAERIKDDMKAIMEGRNYQPEVISNEDKAEAKSKVKAADAALDIVSPVDGEVVDITSVPDEVFSTRMIGDGFAVIPTSDDIHSPVDGEITSLFPTNHAVGITSEEGLEILIHIGIDTVNLKGEGFESHIKSGDKVKKGDLLITFDRESIEKKVKSTIVPVVVTNMEMIKHMEVFKGSKKAGDKAAYVNLQQG